MVARLRFYPRQRATTSDPTPEGAEVLTLDALNRPRDPRGKVIATERLWTRSGFLACRPGGEVAVDDLANLVNDEELRRIQKGGR